MPCSASKLHPANYGLHFLFFTSNFSLSRVYGVYADQSAAAFNPENIPFSAGYTCGDMKSVYQPVIAVNPDSRAVLSHLDGLGVVPVGIVMHPAGVNGVTVDSSDGDGFRAVSLPFVTVKDGVSVFSHSHP